MAKNSVADWSRTAADNTDIGGIGITGASLPSNLDNAEREMMAQLATYFTGVGENFLNGQISGLKLSNNASDATNDIDIQSGKAASEASVPTLMTLASALTKRLDAAWAVGTGNGGRDTGAIADGTWHVWLIQRSDTGVVDALFSLSATAPTMPTSYDRKRRIGSIIRSAGAILAFVQDGDVFTLSNSVLDVAASNPGTSAVTRTVTVPTGIRVEAFGVCNILSSSTSSTFYAYLSDLAVADNVAGSNANVGLETQTTAGTYRGFGSWSVFTNTSAQIRSRMDATGATYSLRINTRGWVDTRGRG